MKKRFFTLLVAVCLVAQVMCIPVMAATETTFVESDTTLFMPPTGKLSSLALTMEEGTPALTVPVNENGLSAKNNSLILNGTIATATTEAIAVEGVVGDSVAAKDLTVSNERLFWDFEDGTVGNNQETTLAETLDGTTGKAHTGSPLLSFSRAAVVAEDATGNKYLDCGSDNNKSGIWKFGETLKDSKLVTLEFDATLNAYNYFLRISTANAGGTGYFTLASNSSGTQWWWKSPAQNSAQQSCNTSAPQLNKKYHFIVTLDIDKQNLTMLIDGNTEFNSVDIGTLGDGCYIDGLVFNKSHVDNLAIYSGKPYVVVKEETAFVENDTTLFMPPTGTMSSLPLTMAEGTPALTVSSNDNGIYKNANSLVLDGDTAVATTEAVSVVGEVDDYVATKDVVVSNERLFWNFEDGTVGGNHTTAGTTNIDGTKGASYGATTLSSLPSTTGIGATIREDESGNKYLDTTTGKAVYTLGTIANNKINGILSKTNVVTIEFDANFQAQSWFMYLYGNQYYSRKGFRRLDFGVRSSGANYTYRDYWNQSEAQHGSVKPTVGKWVKIKAVVDFNNSVVKMYENDTQVLDMVIVDETLDNMTEFYIQNAYIDNLAIYSGYPYNASDSIIGTEKILLNTDGYSKYDWTADNAEISENGTISGSKVYGNSLVIDNSASVAGAKNLVAVNSDNNDFIGKKRVAVSDILYYEDFEDGVADAAGSTAKLTKTDGTTSDVSMFVTEDLIADNEGDKYLNIDANEGAYIDLSDVSLNAGKVTLEFDTYGLASRQVLRLYDGNTLLATFGFSSGSGWYISHNTVGESVSYFMNNGGFRGWGNVKIDLDLDNDTFTFSANGNLVGKNVENGVETVFPFIGLAKNVTIDKITFGEPIDNVKIYTGETVALTPNVEVLNVPVTGASDYTLAVDYSDSSLGTPVLTSVTTDNAKVAADGNNLSIASDVSMEAPVVVTVSDGFMTGSAEFPLHKEYVLMGGNEAENGDTLITDAETTISAVYGDSRLSGNNCVIIAKYTNNVLANVVMGDIASKDLSASLTDTFSEADTIKVFIWNMSTIKPISGVTILD